MKKARQLNQYLRFLLRPLAGVALAILLVWIFDHFFSISKDLNLKNRSQTAKIELPLVKPKSINSSSIQTNESNEVFYKSIKSDSKGKKRPVEPFRSNQTSKIESLLQQEENNLYSLNSNSYQEEKRLLALTDAFAAKDLSELKDITLNEKQTSDRRSIGVYLLKLSGIKAHRQMQEIALADSRFLNFKPEPHSVNEARQKLEINLRTIALKAIDQNLYQSHYQLKSFKDDTIEVKNPYLRGLIRILQTGEKEKKQLLTHYFQQALNEGVRD